MAKKRMTRRNAESVLAQFSVFIKNNPEAGRRLIERMNAMLDNALDDDLFGTEGQLDPRGDQRDEEG